MVSSQELWRLVGEKPWHDRKEKEAQTSNPFLGMLAIKGPQDAALKEIPRGDLSIVSPFRDVPECC